MFDHFVLLTFFSKALRNDILELNEQDSESKSERTENLRNSDRVIYIGLVKVQDSIKLLTTIEKNCIHYDDTLEEY